MRPLRALIIVTGFLLLVAGAGAEPKVAPGYRLETVSVPGAIFAGLSRDGDALLLTDLASGRLYRRGANGELDAFGPVLPHGLDVIGDPTGPYKVVRAGGSLIVAQGWTPASSGEGPFDHALIAVDAAGQARVISSDFWNPFDLVVAGETFYVIDSAKNSVERVWSDGRKDTLISFRRIKAPATTLRSLSPTEFSEGDNYEVDAVPTGIALRDNRLYVTLFGGFPFLAGAGKVVSVPEDGATSNPRLDAEGLNAPVSITFDGDGGMLVLEHGLYDQKDGFRKASGRLLKLEKTTLAPEVILDGLTRPVSILVWDTRRLVISELGGNLYFLTRVSAR